LSAVLALTCSAAFMRVLSCARMRFMPKQLSLSDMSAASAPLAVVPIPPCCCRAGCLCYPSLLEGTLSTVANNALAKRFGVTRDVVVNV
jgi:hypothetical protein